MATSKLIQAGNPTTFTIEIVNEVGDPEDLTGATAMIIKLGQIGITTDLPASVVGAPTLGVITATAAQGLIVPGGLIIQPVVTFDTTDEFHGEKRHFQVESNL